MNDAKKNLSLFALTLLGALLVAELAVRLILGPPGFIPLRVPAGLLVPHEQRSYTFGPGFSGPAGDYHRHGKQIVISINSQGLRDDPIEPGDEIAVLAVGDSFTAGWGVENDEGWPARLEEQLNKDMRFTDIRVVNGGVSGYGMRQIRLFLEELLYLQPKFVVVGVYPMGKGRVENPFVLHGGKIVKSTKVGSLKVVEGGDIKSPMRTTAWSERYFWLAENFYLGAYLLEFLEPAIPRSKAETPNLGQVNAAMTADQQLAPVLAELELINNLLIAEGIPFAVLTVNDQESDGSFRNIQKEYNEVLREFCAINSIPMFDPLPELVKEANGEPIFRFSGNHHWSVAAHDLVGKHVAEHLSELPSFRQAAAGIEEDPRP